ncbi:MAG: PilZ domain-containing protein [Deltaproteobacteria bacterium]|nr:PilZ domain-containing protein [Deltaproteobacteria bacterium]
MSDQPSQRRYPRVRVPLLVQYRFSPVEEYQTDYLADLSRNGMFIYADQPRPAGTLLSIQFVTRDGSRIVRGQGRIVRTETSTQPDGRTGQAVEFVDFDADDLRFLDELVRRYQDEQARPKQRSGRRPSSSTLRKR